MKEAENKHFDVTKYFNPLVFVLKQDCCIRKGQQDSRKYLSSSFSFHQMGKSMSHNFRLSVQQVPFLASFKWKAKMKVAFCRSMVTCQTIGIPLRTNKRILKYLLLRQKAHMCSYLHSPTRISVNNHNIKISQKLYLLEIRWSQNWYQWPKLTLNQFTKLWNQCGWSPSVINYATQSSRALTNDNNASGVIPTTCKIRHILKPMG